MGTCHEHLAHSGPELHASSGEERAHLSLCRLAVPLSASCHLLSLLLLALHPPQSVELLSWILGASPALDIELAEFYGYFQTVRGPECTGGLWQGHCEWPSSTRAAPATRGSPPPGPADCRVLRVGMSSPAWWLRLRLRTGLSAVHPPPTCSLFQVLDLRSHPLFGTLAWLLLLCAVDPHKLLSPIICAWGRERMGTQPPALIRDFQETLASQPTVPDQCPVPCVRKCGPSRAGGAGLLGASL